MKTPLFLLLICVLLTAATTLLALPVWVLPIALCATLAAFVIAALAALRGGTSKPSSGTKAIAIDGSNLLYWRGDTPDLATVAKILRQLEAQGRHPKVWFDANVGYLVAARYLGAAELARMLKIDRADVTVAAKGEPADPLILTAALAQNMPVLSNDRFRDWHEAFPAITEPGRLLRGRFIDGALRLDPALTPKSPPKPASPLAVPGERRRAKPSPKAQVFRRQEPRF